MPERPDSLEPIEPRASSVTNVRYVAQKELDGVMALRSALIKVSLERDEALAEVKRLRRDVRAVVREWKDYPVSYRRAALIEDLLSALDGGT